MAIREQLLSLQWAQLKHDEAYHRDIVILPLAQRISHMALHNAKYTGYFFAAIDGNEPDRLMRTLTDAFTIALASANALNQDLGCELETKIGNEVSLHALGLRLTDTLPRDSNDPLWLVRRFAQYSGQLAKACESLDHLEAMPFRELMSESNLAFFMTVLAEASARGADLAEAYKSRMRDVESKSIFDTRYRAGAGGEA